MKTPEELRSDFERVNAAALVELHVHEFLLALLRGLANDGPFDNVIENLAEFLRISGEQDVDAGAAMSAGLYSLSERALPPRQEGESEYSREITSVVRAAIRVAAERGALDNAARGRESQREDTLMRAIKTCARGRI